MLCPFVSGVAFGKHAAQVVRRQPSNVAFFWQSSFFYLEEEPVYRHDDLLKAAAHLAEEERVGELTCFDLGDHQLVYLLAAFPSYTGKLFQ